MATLSQGIGLGALPLPRPRTITNDRRSFATARLNEAFRSAKVVPFDDSSRFIFFSDCHRGDNSRADSFVRNKELYLYALTHYYRAGFTYVEVGDGDELWKNRKFSDIQRAHQGVFDLFHKFNQGHRLHLILGNHDLQDSRGQRLEKDGIPAHEGLILRHTRTGQRIFVVHGHQADFVSDRLAVMGRLLVRHLWKPLQILGLIGTTSLEYDTRKRGKIEQRLIEWVEDNQLITICGHTHRPTLTCNGAAPYFNAGSCIYPGYITGLELQDGQLMLVKWTAESPTSRQEKPRIPQEHVWVKRQLMASPTPLQLFN